MSELDSSWDAQLTDIRRSVRYHGKRMRFFDLMGKWTSGLSVFLGSAAVASVLPPGDYKWITSIASILVVVIQTIDLIIGSSKVAREHSDLARRFVLLESDIVRTETPSTKVLKDFEVNRLLIEADEPPVMRMLDVICHNEMCASIGASREQMYKIAPIKRLLAQFINFDTDGISKLGPGDER